MTIINSGQLFKGTREQPTVGKLKRAQLLKEKECKRVTETLCDFSWGHTPVFPDSEWLILKHKPLGVLGVRGWCLRLQSDWKITENLRNLGTIKEARKSVHKPPSTPWMVCELYSCGRDSNEQRAARLKS